MNNIASFWKRIDLTEKLLYLYVLLIPIMQMPYLPVVGRKIQYSDIIFLALFGVWLAQFLYKNRRFEATPLLLTLALMLTAFLLSFLNSIKRFESMIEFAGIFYLVALYFLLCQIITSEKIWWRVVKMWTMVSLTIAMVGLIGYAFSLSGLKDTIFIQQANEFNRLDKNLVYRICSTFVSGGMLVTYLNTGIIFGIILIAKGEIPSRILKYLSSFFISSVYILAGLLTKTRGILGMALSLFLIVVFCPNKGKVFSVLRWILFIIFSLILVSVIISSLWVIFPVRLDIDQIGRAAFINFNTAPSLYLALGISAINMIKDHPFLGVGMGMYNYRSYEYDDLKIASKAYETIGIIRIKGEKGYDPHSTYLGWAAETGLVGLSLILFFLLGAVHKIYKGLITFKIHRFFYCCLLASLAGFLIDGFYIDILTMRHFWFLIAMSMVLLNLDKKYGERVSTTTTPH